MKKVLVIMGSTASGKSDLSIKLAKEFNGEIISCDSVQVYKGMDIGSAKIKEEEMQGIVHHMIDILDVHENMNVAFFQEKARTLIDDITSRRKLPICVGGTGFYIKALLYDYQFEKEEENFDDEYDVMSNEELHDLLVTRDEKESLKIHVNNRKRLLRVHRLMDQSNVSKSELLEKQSQTLLYDAQIFYLTHPREILVNRINERVDQMIEDGLLDEVESISNHGENFNYQSLSAIGYKEFEAYFKKEKTLDEVISDIKTHTRQFSKRQMTWFKHQLKGTLINVSEESYPTMAYRVSNWLDNDKI